MDRDCATCVYKTATGCSAWECEYINRQDAIEAYKREKARERNEAD